MKYASTSIIALGLAMAVAGCTTVAQTGYPSTGSGSYQGGYAEPRSELVLFDGRNYYGIARVLGGPEDRLDYIDFNDRAASLDIRGGGYGWLVCHDAYFEGPCLVVRESVDDLDELGMGDKISSVRPLSPRNPYPHGTIFGENPYGEVVFYESDYFGNLSEMDPYDAYGYAAYDYGYATSYRTGRYGNYGRYGQYNPYNPYRDRHSDRSWSGYRGPTNADIVLYKDAYYAGSAYGLKRNAWDLSSLYFNDEVSSIEIRSGRWEVCTDSNFRGRCEILDASTGALSFMNDSISSVRRVGHEGGGRYDDGNGGRYGDRDGGRGNGWGGGRDGDRGQTRGDLVLFEHGSYQGRSVGISTDIPNVTTLGLNDAASSIEIRSGTWEVCEHPNYGGRCQIIDASSTNLNFIRMNDNISSLRRVTGGRPPRDDDRGESDWSDRDQENDRDDRGGWDRGNSDEGSDRRNDWENQSAPDRDELNGGPEAPVVRDTRPPGIRALERERENEARADREAEARAEERRQQELQRMRQYEAARQAEEARQREEVERRREQAERDRMQAEARAQQQMRERAEDARRSEAAAQEARAQQMRLQAERQRAEEARRAEAAAREAQAQQVRMQQERARAAQQAEQARQAAAAREAAAREAASRQAASPPPPPPPPPRPRENLSKQERLIQRMQEEQRR